MAAKVPPEIGPGLWPDSSQLEATPPGSEPRVEMLATEVVSATKGHMRTIILLHGFTGTGKSFIEGWDGEGVSWLREMKKRNPDGCDTTKFVFPTAPLRTISCYGEAASLTLTPP